MHSFPLCAQVHYPPYLFEAFLLEPVDDVRSAAKVGNGVVVISLSKKANKIWDHLVIPTRKTCPFIDWFYWLLSMLLWNQKASFKLWMWLFLQKLYNLALALWDSTKSYQRGFYRENLPYVEKTEVCFYLSITLALPKSVLVLQMCIPVNKEKKEAIRGRALIKYQEKLCSDSKSKAAKKQAEKKYALESMMKVRLDDTHDPHFTSWFSPNYLKFYSLFPLCVCVQIQNDFEMFYITLKAWKWRKKHDPENEGHWARENDRGAGSLATETEETNSTEKSRKKSEQCRGFGGASGEQRKWR